MTSIWNTARSDATMEVLRAAISPLVDAPAPGGTAVFVMGSLARRELAPYSDKDVLVFHDDGVDEARVRSIVTVLIASMEHVSVVARAPGEVDAMLDDDMRSWLAMFEARFIAGDERLRHALRLRLREHIVRVGSDEIERRIAGHARARHRQYGDSVALLEPNVKNSAGALRDLQSIYHVALVRHAHRAADDDVYEPPTFDQLAHLLPMHHQRITALIDAWALLLTIRERLHEDAGHLHDVLEYEMQRRVGARLGYGDAGARETVEAFMRDYYAAARQTRRAWETLFLSSEHDRTSEAEVRRLDDTFIESRGILHVAGAVDGEDRLPDVDGDALVEAFERVRMLDLEVGADVIRVIDRTLARGAGTWSIRGWQAFDRILRGRERVGTTVRRMHDLDLLGAGIPEFGRLCSYFQHNIYHYYTADEHTIIALEQCESLREDEGPLGTVFRGLQDRSPLYYAVLFHDIAKPVDLPRHEIAGAAIAHDTLVRIGRADIADDVALVVRWHLLMEQIAFRRNYHDHGTLEPFARLIGTPARLDLLYLLTFADMSALNPSVWTQWKHAMLDELYRLARGVLAAPSPAPSVRGSNVRGSVSARSGNTARRVSTSATGGEVRRDAHAGDMDEDMLRVERGDADIVVRVHAHDTHSEAVVIGRDAPYFLSRIAAVFLAADVSIIAAHIDTRQDGMAVDRFRVVDIIDGGALPQERAERLQEIARAVWRGESDTEALFSRQRAKWKRRLRRTHNPSTRVDVEYHDHVRSDGVRLTIVEVYAPDTYGLLYRLTQVISSFRLTIAFASIATRVDGVVDSFYVTDTSGSALDDTEMRAELRTALLSHIAALTGGGSGEMNSGSVT